MLVTPCLSGSSCSRLIKRYYLVRPPRVLLRARTLTTSGPQPVLDEDEELKVEKAIKADTSVYVPYSSLYVKTFPFV